LDALVKLQEKNTETRARIEMGEKKIKVNEDLKALASREWKRQLTNWHLNQYSGRIRQENILITEAK
jgi:hypothetical protein